MVRESENVDKVIRESEKVGNCWSSEYNTFESFPKGST